MKEYRGKGCGKKFVKSLSQPDVMTPIVCYAGYASAVAIYCSYEYEED
ncbi:hypothetical protein KAU85_05040 [Candidatus Bathyarchaeota archaeon]|nr:hypothetical protein [Candidatus Bathyarchaeota archaeon]